MPPELPEEERVRLIHMVWAASDALDFTRGRDRASLDADRMLFRAVIHCVQEMGEAAGKVSSATRVLVPEMPWNQIVGMRHRLVHAYFAINADYIWQVVAGDLPVLVRSLTALLVTIPAREGDEPSAG